MAVNSEEYIIYYKCFVLRANFVKEKKFDLIFIFGTSPVFQAIQNFSKTVKKYL